MFMLMSQHFYVDRSREISESALGMDDIFQVGVRCIFTDSAVTDLGGRWGQLPPLHDENSALTPSFWQEQRPCIVILRSNWIYLFTFTNVESCYKLLYVAFLLNIGTQGGLPIGSDGGVRHFLGLGKDA